MNETELLWLAIGRVPYFLPRVRVFRREIYSGKTATGGYIKIGRPGQGDAYWMADRDVHANWYGEIEAKSAIGQYRAAQVNWRTFCGDRSIPHITWRVGKKESPDDTVARWIAELKEAVG